MSALPDILRWDEEAPPAPSRGDWPMGYDDWENRRLLKRDAAIIALGRGPNQTTAPETEEVSEELIAAFWPS